MLYLHTAAVLKAHVQTLSFRYASDSFLDGSHLLTQFSKSLGLQIINEQS